MDTANIFNNLNEKQRQAVTAPLCNLSVIAGAGSGKTRVLVHRIAWLLSVEHCPASSIMAVTFTNKASEEMRHRIECLSGDQLSDMWIGTFHGLAHRLLRAHYIEANLPKDFQILDSTDQLRLIKRIINFLNINEMQLTSRQAIWYINKIKDENFRSQHIKCSNNPIDVVWRRIYQAYQEICDRSGLVDFTELLLRAHALWLNKPHILHDYRKRFTNILVDEFQDINNIQYAWIHLLADNNSNVMIVGDDDQSIYSWRGAQIKNMRRFLQDFPSAKTIRLEQNYRSTSNILKAANTLIAYNDERIEKNLWTDRDQGKPILIYCADNELNEAWFVVNRIKIWRDNGGTLNDCAILYRNNTQSRVLEEMLLQSNMSYHIYGGHRFFERQEIKDVMAYLRLISNCNDDTAFERIINIPTRGIGRQTLDIIRKTARNNKLTMWQATQQLLHKKTLDVRAISTLQRFITLINSLTSDIINMPLHIQTKHVIHKSGLFLMYQQKKDKNSQAYLENLEELVTATQQYNHQNNNHNLTPMQAFLSHAALEASNNQASIYQDTVKLMTLHSSKGLEFPSVFIVGMEEGMFPNQMLCSNSDQLEEERRLAYVGITRAMQQLTLTYTKMRHLYGIEVCHRPSRFIKELPKSCIKEIPLHTNLSHRIDHYHTNISINDNYTGYKHGQRVKHSKFGEGIIIKLEGHGKHSRLKIAFPIYGVKWFVVAHTCLKIL
ncbi:DNA helicase II [Candidatus Gillettellia adelgis]